MWIDTSMRITIFQMYKKKTYSVFTTTSLVFQHNDFFLAFLSHFVIEIINWKADYILACEATTRGYQVIRSLSPFSRLIFGSLLLFGPGLNGWWGNIERLRLNRSALMRLVMLVWNNDGDCCWGHWWQFKVRPQINGICNRCGWGGRRDWRWDGWGREDTRGRKAMVTEKACGLDDTSRGILCYGPSNFRFQKKRALTSDGGAAVWNGRGIFCCGLYLRRSSGLCKWDNSSQLLWIYFVNLQYSMVLKYR